jgi:hypothetical protein
VEVHLGGVRLWVEVETKIDILAIDVTDVVRTLRVPPDLQASPFRVADPIGEMHLEVAGIE